MINIDPKSRQYRTHVVSESDLLDMCELMIQKFNNCRAYDGSKCVANDEDFIKASNILCEIYDYRKFTERPRRIKSINELIV